MSKYWTEEEEPGLNLFFHWRADWDQQSSPPTWIKKEIPWVGGKVANYAVRALFPSKFFHWRAHGLETSDVQSTAYQALLTRTRFREHQSINQSLRYFGLITLSLCQRTVGAQRAGLPKHPPASLNSGGTDNDNSPTKIDVSSQYDVFERHRDHELESLRSNIRELVAQYCSQELAHQRFAVLYLLKYDEEMGMKEIAQAINTGKLNTLRTWAEICTDFALPDTWEKIVSLFPPGLTDMNLNNMWHNQRRLFIEQLLHDFNS